MSDLPDYTPKNKWAEWHLTYQCDLECVHCARLSFLRPSTPSMILPDAEDFVRQCREIGWLPGIRVMGGEPTLHPDFHGFLEIAAQLGTHIEIYSNAYSQHARDVLANVKHGGVLPYTQKPKGSVVHPVTDMCIAPADFGESRAPCQIWHSAFSSQATSGISVDAAGYGVCPCAGAIDGILGLGLLTRRLADLFDRQWAYTHTMALCRWCGVDRGLRGLPEIHGSEMSKTWHAAVSQKLK